MDQGNRPPELRRRFHPLLAVPVVVGAVTFAAALAAGARSGDRPATALAEPATEIAASTPAPLAPAPAEAPGAPDAATADAATTEAATTEPAGAAPAGEPAATAPAPAASAETPAPARRGHAAPPRPKPDGPDLSPLRRDVDVPVPGAQVPALFFPDPLRPVPEADLGILREEDAPDTSPAPTPEERRQMVEFGRELFFSTTAFDQQPSRGNQVLGERLACATCHSGPGFTDNRTHLIGPTDERELVPRATPHLFGLTGSAPFGWDGRNENLEEQARGAITSDLEMNGREPTVKELAALRAFQEQIVPPPAVPGVDFDPELAKLGEQLFKDPRGIDPAGEFSPNVKISCETCHLGALRTDNKPHRILVVDEFGDPGQVDEDDNIRGFDTPPLIGLRFTAPYFHQNAAGDPTAPANLVYGTDAARFALRNNVLNFYNARFDMGFSDDQLNALTEFLMSL